MLCLTYEDFATHVALEEVRTLRVHDLHLLPLPCVVEFQDRAGRETTWTTDRDYWEMHKATGAKKPSQYTLDASAPGETVGEFEKRSKVRLVRVRVVHREERKVDNV